MAPSTPRALGPANPAPTGARPAASARRATASPASVPPASARPATEPPVGTTEPPVAAAGPARDPRDTVVPTGRGGPPGPAAHGRAVGGPGRWGGPLPSRPLRRYGHLLAPAVLALGTGLWGVRREHTLWRDESTTYQVAHRDLGEIVRLLGTADVVHGLYYLLMHALFACWEGGLLALRLPSVLATVAATVGVVLIGRRLTGPGAGLAAGLVFPLLPPVQHYAQEGRSYALVCACVVWGTYLLLRAVARPGRWAWAGYAGVMALACLLHEFAVLALLAHGLTLRCARVSSELRWSWASTGAGVAVLLVPLVVLSQQQAQQVAWIPPPTPTQLATFLALAAAVSAVARVPMGRRGPIGLPALALPMFIVPTALLMGVSFLHPLYVDRYVLYGWLGLALLAGAALDGALRVARRHGPTATGLLCGAVAAVIAVQVPSALALRTPHSRLDDVRGAARVVNELSDPGDGLLFLPYHRREPLMSAPEEFRGLTDLARAQDGPSSGTLWGTKAPAAVIRARMLRMHRIVTLTDPPSRARHNPREALERDVLRRHFTVCERRAVPTMRIVRYARRGQC